MKLPIKILIFLSFVSSNSFGQGAKAIILNNYVGTCKAKNFFAFNFFSTGMQLLETGQYNRSVNKFTKAIKNDSTYCDAWYLSGLIYLHAKQDTVIAKKQLTKALELGYPLNSVLTEYIKR